MTATLLTSLAAFSVALSPADAPAPALRRLALIVGTNDGGTTRPLLRYATSDAKSFARVLDELGGVTLGDRIVVLDANRSAFLDGIAQLQRLAAAARGANARTEVIVYYSGHSDGQGLLLRGERLEYQELRAAISGLSADVRIAILDSCASGSFTRRKGGTHQPAFLVDASAKVQGQAILTSSSSDEASQESDRIGGSFFTHNLVSGLRGAADASRDGKVTLNEAYQFAFAETLARTESSQAGAQHAAYDIDLAGSGELVMTDVRATSAGLLLADTLDGRFYLRDSTGALVVELNKGLGRPTELGLAPGSYSVSRDLAGKRSRAELTLVEGKRTVLEADAFVSVPTEATALRGEPPVVEGVAALKRVNVGVALIPGISTNDQFEGPVENTFAFALVAGRSGRLRGFALGTVLNITDLQTQGVQLSGATNFSGGDVAGVQIGGLSNHAPGLVGLQVAGGFNVASKSATAVQASGGFNWTSAGMTGAQLTGGFNWAGQLDGLQASGGFNGVGRGRVGQFSVVNLGGDITGAQVGVINIARTLRGAQLGVINVAKEVHGGSVGIFSIIGNGLLRGEAYTSDVTATNVALKLGSQYAYTIFDLGALRTTQGQAIVTSGLGLGAHIPVSQPAFVELDVLGRSVYDPQTLFTGNDQSLLSQARITVGWQFARRFAVIAGPTFNVNVRFDGADASKLSFMPGGGGQGIVRYWPGFRAGIQI